jgi:YihY family inner membrane protein
VLAASVLVNIAFFTIAFRVLTVRDVGWKQLLPGAVVAAVAWQVLQTVGGAYMTHQLDGMSDTYGTFAVVLGLLSWLYLQARIVLYAAEINVVLAGGLWPRGLGQPLTRADRRALRSYAEVEERRVDTDVDVEFA